MAAPRKSRLAAGDDSSSSDGEEQQRLREAAWEPPGSLGKNAQYQDNAASPAVPSLRVRPDNHEHDGNELETTPEFRTHVAKKLAAMLDSCIKEVSGSNRFNQKSTSERDSEDEGFRLLTTSVPGDTGEILPSPTVKRRMESSTSEDSEEEQRRYREAAVSGLDILRDSALQTTSAEIVGTANTDQSKKKKKRKPKKERGLSDETETDVQNMKPKGKINGCKKKSKEIGVSDVTQLEDQTIQLESEKKSKKKTASDCHNKSEMVKDNSKKKKKEMGLSDETVSNQNRSPECGKSATKKKKKKAVVGNSDEHY